MTSPFRKPKSSNSIAWKKLVSLALWLVVGLVLARILSWTTSTVLEGWGSKADFKAAFAYVAQMENNPQLSSAPEGQARFGITQTDYDTWRQQHNQSPQPLAQMTQNDVKDIYHYVWKQGDCDQYEPPLDVACLDSVVSFGVEESKSFLTQLPSEPKQAALEVARRREAYRQQIADRQRSETPSSYDDRPSVPGYGRTPRGAGAPYRMNPRPFAPNLPGRAFPAPYPSPSTPYNQQNSQVAAWVQAGLTRDRALARYAAQTNPGWLERFTQWLGFGASSPPSTALPSASTLPDTASSRTQSPTESAPPAATVSPSPTPKVFTANDIGTNAKQFTVEVWLTGVVNGESAPASGVILTEDGTILTNYHVITSGTASATLPIRLANGKEYQGDVIEQYSDRSLDLALIKLENAKGLPTAPLSTTSKQVKVGDTVYAMGSPEGEHWKLTTAAVIELESPCGLPQVGCIRTPSGFLRPGNSGGPLMDASGTVVGINRAIQGRTGEGVSLPIEVIRNYVQQAGIQLPAGDAAR